MCTPTSRPARSEASVLERLAAPPGSDLPLPRLLVILAHPDDEVVALGARLERLRTSKLLSVTDGAPLNGDDARAHGFPTLNAYRTARQTELHAALAHAGLPPEIAAPLPTIENGSTRVLADQTAALHLPQLTRAVAHAIELHRPEAVLTHPYEGGHPDHDSCAFAVHTAILLLPADERPPILEATFYHAAPQGIETGSFLHPEATPSAVCRLSPSEQASKRDRLACFTSQSATLAQFGAETEQFRIAPRYDFREPPHPGQLFYERFPWGMSGERFRELAAAALASLRLSPKPAEGPPE